MKYFSPSYWFKLWLLSAPLFNDETKGINAMSINNKKIKDWASNNTSLDLINQEISFTNSTSNYQPYNLSPTNQNINPFYQTELETSNHKHRHEKSRNRHKRQPNPNRRAIFQLTEQLTIDSNNRQQYRNSFQSVLASLVRNNILRVVFDNTENANWGEINRIFTLNTENYGYFRLPVVIRWQQNEQSLQRNFELVLRTDNLYIQGFIVTERGSHIGEISTYYHFNFDNINPNMQPRAVQDGTVPHLLNIDGMQSRQLTGISPDYRDMIPTQNNNINWNSVVNSFIVLTNDINVSEEHSLGNLAISLGQVVFMSAEAIRFPDIYARIVTHLINRNENLEFNRRSEIYRILVSWSQRSRNNILQQRLIEAINNVNNPNWNGFTMLDLITELNSPSVQVLLGYINFRLRNNGGNVNCRRGKRELINKFWHEKFCDLKPQIDKIQGKITAIKILDENNKSSNLKEGTIYVGTENGVYLIYPEDEVHRFDNLNFPITNIKLDGKGSAYVTNDRSEIYHLNLVGWGSEKLKNIESFNLEEEIKIYYEDNHDNLWIENNWFFGDRNTNVHLWKTIMLKKLNPLCYKKIDFIGEHFDWTRTSWGSWKFTEGRKLLTDWNKSNFKDIAGNYKIFESNKDYIRKYSNLNVQNLPTQYYLGTQYVEGKQYFGLTWYEENYEFYLQFLYDQFYKHYSISGSGSGFIGVGKGIKLYDYIQDCESYKLNINKREIFNIKDLKEKNDLKNITKWTDEFTKDINYEQHLPIDNKSNFSTNNITSL
ncbi:ribosome-inactivating family protein [Spiroplasma endosymbiont of Danaus chrysippus]|uniref:ribosome-inactivating family protein n=1 Tax=Spiroplasma endosymbiont of Danaus chrysippus TaxID=2691041 RepID=UPI00157AF7EC|nr:ribosome-inactivating family protein [Spiroplasma endosymbiont of Danaus chrysippus]